MPKSASTIARRFTRTLVRLTRKTAKRNAKLAKRNTKHMMRLGKTFAKLGDQRRRWETMAKAAGALARVPSEPRDVPSRLTEVFDFASNPGALRMFSYVPRGLPEDRPLVVVLHGCTQTAASYDLGAGWSHLADRYGFALLFAQQVSANNPNRCFNWFLRSDIRRGRGEALSIRQMVEWMLKRHSIDRKRVFVTGLSAGGAMANVMLATYPETFAAGAIIAGLPYGTAENASQAFESMFQVRPRSPAEWGDLVRDASSYRGPWPRVSVWHGGADETVRPANAGEIIKQWTNVHEVPQQASAEAIVSGYPRRVWRDARGDDVVESYTISGMAHGTPLATGGPDAVGTAGPFMLEAGIASSFHIAKFFGLTGQPAAATEVQQAVDDAPKVQHEVDDQVEPSGVQEVIAKALRAAGLLPKHG
jgi:feruloyl esterase